MPDFAWPWVFFLLPLPWLFRYGLRPALPAQALHLPQPGLKLSEKQTTVTGRVLPWLLALTWLCLLCAAARPQWLGPPQTQQHSGRALMLAVDLSASMQTPDMTLAGRAVSRFTAVKAIVNDFVSRRDGDDLGIVLFGSRAFLVTPLTYDLSAVRAQLRDAVVGLTGSRTAFGDAIAVSVKRLSALPRQSRVLVLLTDGVNNAGNIKPLVAARVARTTGVRIYTIGIGATTMRISGFFGSQLVNPSADLNVEALTQIAQLTGGHFYRAIDSQQLVQAYRAIDALEPVAQPGPQLRLRQEAFRWPLLTALLLLLLAWCLKWQESCI